MAQADPDFAFHPVPDWGLNVVSAESVDGREYDVVIVGGGGSGATAALEVCDRGKTPLVIEKTGEPGGSTQESGGSLRIVSPEERDDVLEHYVALTQGATPRDVMTAFVDGLVAMPDWIRSLGGDLVPHDPEADSFFPARRPGSAFPDAPYAEKLGARARVRPTYEGRTRGASLWDLLAAKVAKFNVPLVLNSRVTRLIPTADGNGVAGVEISRGQGAAPITVRARNGVILACGGYNYDPDLQRQYFGLPMPALSPPGKNTGDGIRLAQHVGADLWHMTAAAATVGYKFDDYEAAFWLRMPDYGFVLVDQRARRYVAEMQIENHAALLSMLAQDPLSGQFVRAPSFVVFDEQTRMRGPLATLKTGQNRHFQWSPDNSKEIERGWIKTADTLQDLADLLGLPGDALVATVREFNACAESGVADHLGRRPDEMRPIVHAPFYGAVMYPTLVNTQGGPRRSARGEILRPDKSPIVGLYGAGELGSIWNRLYPGAGNICECLVYGRIAAASACADGT